MGVSMFEREALEKRVERGPNIAIAAVGLLVLLVAYGWWMGEIPPVGVLGGLLYLGLAAGLALAARQEDLPTRLLGLVLLLLAGAAIWETVRRPLRFDLLVWVGVFLVLRSFLASRRLAETEDRGRR